MRIYIEVDFDAEYFEDNNDRVTLQALRLPGCRQNLLPNLSPEERASAQTALENAYEQAAIDKVIALCEKHEMRAEMRRDRARDDRLTGDL